MDLLTNTSDYNLTDWRTLGPPITEHHAGKRADLYLAKQYPFLTRNAWQKRVDCDQVHVNGRAIKSNYRLKNQDVIHYYHPEVYEPPVDDRIQILWQDQSVMAVLKPGNLPMHENGAYRKKTFAKLLSDLAGREWSAVHRLDRETSGIVLCGSSSLVRQKLADDFESKKIAKEYLMIVDGIPSQTEWTVDAPLGDLVDSKIRIKRWVTPDGVPSETSFVVEATNDHIEDENIPQVALLRAFPRTGRTNQIRIHAAYSGHWLLGDKLYHPNENVFLDYWDHHTTTDFCIEQTRFHRCCLHAAALTFKHPETRKMVRVTADLPDDMAELASTLRVDLKQSPC